jgi:hypothetical protein
MRTERKPGATPAGRPPFATAPGSRNRGFQSSDPERQREVPADAQRTAPAGTLPQERVPQASRGTPATRRARARRDGG